MSKKNIILNKAFVLLISDREEDYIRLMTYGFKNIHHFKSIIKCFNYFEKHPEDLNIYNVIFESNRNANLTSLAEQKKLDLMIFKLDKQKCVHIDLNRYIYSDHTETVGYIDYKPIKNPNYPMIFDKIIEAIKEKELCFKSLSNNNCFPILEDSKNHNKLQVPKRKRDLKILYLYKGIVDENLRDLASKLGLNIIFKEDDEFALENDVLKKLGDYDIIVASDRFSSNLVNMNVESIEQCKETGRNLTLLVTYDVKNILQYDEDKIIEPQVFGDQVNLKYSFGGILTEEAKVLEKEYKVIKSNTLESILSGVVEIYNKKMLELTNISLKDLDLRTLKVYKREYILREQEENSRKKESLKPIKDFDELRFSVLEYLNNRNSGLTPKKLSKLRITETKKGVCIEQTVNGRVLYSLVFQRKYDGNLRVFTMRTLDGKESILAFYTKFYENKESILTKPNKQQLEILQMLEQTVKQVIVPLNEEAIKYQSSGEPRKRKR